MNTISFFSEDVSFTFSQKKITKRWISEVIKNENHDLSHLNFIFCSDEYLLSVNQQYLAHDYYTDIITFNNSEDPECIEGDIFISIDRVKDNANTSQLSFRIELHRVIIHGVLHLLGYDDHSPEDMFTIRQKEDSYLSLLGDLLS